MPNWILFQTSLCPPDIFFETRILSLHFLRGTSCGFQWVQKPSFWGSPTPTPYLDLLWVGFNLVYFLGPCSAPDMKTFGIFMPKKITKIGQFWGKSRWYFIKIFYRFFIFQLLDGIFEHFKRLIPLFSSEKTIPGLRLVISWSIGPQNHFCGKWLLV